MTRRYSSPNLGDAAKQLRMLSITCERCNRFGRYRIDKLIEKYGPDIPTTRREAFDAPELTFELKFDGFRAIADTVNGRMLSKRGNRMHRFEALLGSIPADCVLDGPLARGAAQRWIAVTDGVPSQGRRLFELVAEMDLEGIAAKRLCGPHAPGRDVWKILNRSLLPEGRAVGAVSGPVGTEPPPDLAHFRSHRLERLLVYCSARDCWHQGMVT